MLGKAVLGVADNAHELGLNKLLEVPMRIVRHEELVAAAGHKHHGHREPILVVIGVNYISHQLRARVV